MKGLNINIFFLMIILLLLPNQVFPMICLFSFPLLDGISFLLLKSPLLYAYIFSSKIFWLS